MSLPDHEAAFWAEACLCAEDQYDLQGAEILEPAIDARLARAWAVRGFLTALDAIFRKGPISIDPRRRFWGWLLESVLKPGTFLAVIRGTDGWEEWVEDFEGDPCSRAPFPGLTEAGFGGIYSSMLFRRPGGPDTDPVLGIANAVGHGSLTVTGHSLGAVQAELLSFCLASSMWLGARVAGRYIASPHPGNGDFSKAFGVRVPDHMMWRNVKDRVPQVPLGLGYCSVPRVTELVPGGVVLVDDRDGLDLAAHHHATTYMALALQSRIPASSLLPIDGPYLACLSFA